MMVCLSTLVFPAVLKPPVVRFALKVGMGASLYAMFAFIPLTRPFYQVIIKTPGTQMKKCTDV